MIKEILQKHTLREYWEDLDETEQEILTYIGSVIDKYFDSANLECVNIMNKTVWDGHTRGMNDAYIISKTYLKKSLGIGE